VSQHTGPICWLSNEHQGTQETQSQSKEDEEAEYRVIYTDDGCVSMVEKDRKDSYSEAGTHHRDHCQGYTQGIIGQELHYLEDADGSVNI